ncbi:DNA-binding LacI/PurR family transcriptional regulator [Caldicoprobacter guelmensis]|uniref:LacI family DNA-binding transcriptional regulator n=1 Tax=Caldicoprobacter guelmensis TaxID=1170224 RepID=UPI00195694D6|nr:LacI family DNA-binding transcriptional regulator [Caldicoprobacter guelmensis]MBM7583321.1 DNA-binding LacI/PurR family transcriptional regulator [Caldicoprobacter guelmensis]
MRKKKSVSSKDVAREAGVSQATVSYILNNVKGIKIRPETRQAVLDAIKKLNYHPDQIARGMKLKRSMSVGVVTDRNVTNFYFMKTLEGIRDGLQAHNYSVSLLFNKYESIQEAEFIKYYNSNRIDGIIFAFASISDEDMAYMDSMGIPYVMVNTYSSGKDVGEVCTDHLAHIQEVIGYFKSKGVKYIAYAGPVPRRANDKRLEAFKEAMVLHGYQVKDDRIVLGGQDNGEVCRAIMELLEGRDSRPDAILAASPRFGMLTVKSCHMLGIRIPQDVRIVAVGSSNFFELIYPTLSSIELPLYDMGLKAAEMVLKAIDDGSIAPTIVLPSEFVIRESS